MTDSAGGRPSTSRWRLAADVLRGRPVPEPASAAPNPPGDPVGQALQTLAAVPARELQARGFDLIPRDFYSPANDLAFLEANRDLWHDRPLPADIDWDLDAQLARVQRLAPYLAELEDVPSQAPGGEPAYCWDNDFWGHADAAVHYGLVRELRPARVVEVGCGWSSLLLARALERNERDTGRRTAVTQVEPFPREELMAVLPDHWTRHRTTLQRAPLEAFAELQAGDVCFYDGSHVARAGSDVVWFFFEVLPRLQPGVIVHLHDIFWPDDYRDEWILERAQTWNEQYVLQAFLMYNARFAPLVCNSALYRLRRAEVDAALARLPIDSTGASVWLECRGPSA